MPSRSPPRRRSPARKARGTIAQREIPLPRVSSKRLACRHLLSERAARSGVGSPVGKQPEIQKKDTPKAVQGGRRLRMADVLFRPNAEEPCAFAGIWRRWRQEDR